MRAKTPYRFSSIFNPNVFYQDDELRKTIETLVGGSIYTGQDHANESVPVAVASGSQQRSLFRFFGALLKLQRAPAGGARPRSRGKHGGVRRVDAAAEGRARSRSRLPGSFRAHLCRRLLKNLREATRLRRLTGGA